MPSVWEKIEGMYTYMFDEMSCVALRKPIVLMLVVIYFARSASKMYDDPLTKDWALVPSPVPLLAILIAYNLFCIKIGPMWMKNRPPYELKTPLHIYNTFQVLISLYLSYEGYVYLFSGHFNFNCQGVTEGEERVSRAIQVYFMTKLLELLDTIFFVLRKSDRQITFLHLYHHTIMPILTWIILKYIPGGQCVITGTINSVVHFFMYFYYLLSGLGPQYKKYLWWKKYLTIMQLVQFSIVLIHNCNSLFYSCSQPTILKIISIVEAITFLSLFGKFYYNSYVIREKKGKNKYSANNGHSSYNGKTILVERSDFIGYSNPNGYSNNGIDNKNVTNGKAKGINMRNVNNKKDGKSKKQ